MKVTEATIATDRTIPTNQQHIIIRDNEKETCMSIDVAISGYRNVIKKVAEKIPNYIDLTTQIQRMWNGVKSYTSNNRGNRNNLKIIQKIPEQHTGKARTKELQKTVTLGTAHILWEVPL
jgi:hypothetical protein